MKQFRNRIFKNVLKAQIKGSWTNTYIPRSNFQAVKNVSVIPGAGIGPELVNSVQEVFQAANVPIKFDNLPNYDFSNPESVKQLNRNILLGVPPKEKNSKFAKHYKFYKQLGIFAKITTANSVPNIPMKHQGVDLVIIRERTEGEYSGIEHEIYPGVVESIKVTTKESSLRIAEYAFQFAYISGRKKVTAVHKANIMKLVDGLFLEACREVAQKYPFIQYEEMIVDNTSMQLVKTPQQFDVMVTPNLYGTLCSNIASGITGGNGMIPGAQIGENYSVFAQGNMHSGEDIAGQNIVNPTGILLSSVQMLRHMDYPQFADNIGNAISKTLQDGNVRTRDIGGNSSTSEYVKAVVDNL